MKKTIWSPEAAEDLRTIYRFYLLINPQFATFIFTLIKDEAKRLKHFPEIASVELTLMGYNKEYRSLLVYKLFKLIYYINDNHIVIVAIWDCRRNPETLRQNIK